MKTKYCILFAGVPGSSKSPIAHHIGWNLGLPAFNNDTLRSEVKEDTLEYDVPEYERRRDERAEQLLDKGQPFIYDASIDRSWGKFSHKLKDRGYEYFIISLDPSRERIEKIYKSKEYDWLDKLDQWQSEHDAFLAEYGDEVGIYIRDEDFSRRLDIGLRAVKDWIEG